MLLLMAAWKSLGKRVGVQMVVGTSWNPHCHKFNINSSLETTSQLLGAWLLPAILAILIHYFMISC